MEVAKLDTTQPVYNIPGGTVDLDSKGMVTGIFRENAVLLISSSFTKKKSRSLKMKVIKEGLLVCAKAGLTCVHTNDELCYDIYKELDEKNELPIRVFLTPNIQDMYLPATEGGVLEVKPQNPLTDTNTSSSKISMLKVDRLKIFCDGSLGAETAAIRKYQNRSIDSVDSSAADIENITANSDNTSSQQNEVSIDNLNNNSSNNNNHHTTTKENSNNNGNNYTGVLTYATESLYTEVIAAMTKGWRLEIHVIGDAAADQVLTVLERAGVTPNHRVILTHCQVLGKDLIQRMVQLGVIANIQPSFVPVC